MFIAVPLCLLSIAIWTACYLFILLRGTLVLTTLGRAFFAKITTADKGMTFDLQGNPIIFKRPKGKEMEENMGYNVKSDTFVQTFLNPKHAAN